VVVAQVGELEVGKLEFLELPIGESGWMLLGSLRNAFTAAFIFLFIRDFRDLAELVESIEAALVFFFVCVD